MKILILASNPRKDLNLDREIRDLKDVIEKSGNRQRFEVQDALAVRVGDLQDLLFRHRPQIVHFCGHGSGRQGLVFESNDGGEQWVRAEALSDLFRLFAQNVGCVLLNACYSEEQANAIVNHIDYVIGMSREIQDNAAIAFSRGFYRALGYECSMEQAFEFGRNAIQLEISGSSRMRSIATDELRKAEMVDAIQQIEIPEHLKPILKTKPTRSPGARANITAPEQPLSQETRVAIQLDIDRSLEADAKVKQYRDRVREFLNDRKLTEFEKIRLGQLRKSLGFSEEKARQILTEEEAPLQKARDEYEEMLVRLIEEGHYPFNLEIEQELQQLRQELQLTDLEVESVAQPILQAAEKDHQERLKQQRKAYEDKLQRYRQEFCKAVQVEYPPSQHVLIGLKNFQRQLGLKDEDVAQIEQPIREPLEAKYQEQLRQQELARKQQQEAEYQQKLKSYQEELNRTIELTDYPLSAAALKYLKDYHQSLRLRVEDVERISKPILEQAEAKHQNKLKQQAEAERKRQVEQEKLQKAEYENKLQRYEQEISQIVQREYPLSSTGQANLQKLQNSLGLNQQDTVAINQRILRNAEARYQSRKDAEQQRKQREEAEAERKRQVEMEQMRQKAEYTNKLQRYEQEFRKAIKAQYPLDSFVRHGLRQFQQSLELNDADVAGIEKPIVAPKEAEYQQRLAEEQHIQAEAEAARLKQQEQLKRKADKKRQEQARQPLPDGLKGNYAQLEALLKVGKWKEADRETYKQMFQVIGQQGGHLVIWDIQQFPCADLRTIDQLWVKHSNGKFGFSVQKKIWQRCGSPTEYNKQWEKFGEAVGWRSKGLIGTTAEPERMWKFTSELTFDTSAPEGHLPGMDIEWETLRMWWGGFSSLALRCARCSI